MRLCKSNANIFTFFLHLSLSALSLRVGFFSSSYPLACFQADEILLCRLFENSKAFGVKKRGLRVSAELYIRTGGQKLCFGAAVEKEWLDFRAAHHCILLLLPCRGKFVREALLRPKSRRVRFKPGCRLIILLSVVELRKYPRTIHALKLLILCRNDYVGTGSISAELNDLEN